MSYPKATYRHGNPKPQTFNEASAAYTAAVYRLGADLARALRLHARADRWDKGQRDADASRQEWRRLVMGDHYDGL